ncbi:DUF4184 family protein [Eikenella longinqua]|uniref:DUF4184 family protein n=1 Tax=Eikenella longinqua TaxID=1795827 RepID=UPI001FE16AE9|nr:DUF4184 family protein [Eikenella longinqua]
MPLPPSGFAHAMPFTLAHPVAVLPLARCRRCHFPALVIGSLSPDFVYFLHGRAVAGGHGLADMLWPNLALCALPCIGCISLCGAMPCAIFCQTA